VALAQRGLNRGKLAVGACDPFDGGDLLTVHLHREDEAGSDGLAVEQHRAGTAGAVLAAEMGGGQPAAVTQEVGQRLPRLDVVGSYGVNGVSGTNRPLRTVSTIFSPIDLTGTGGAPRGTRCTPHPSGTGFLCVVPVNAPPSPFAGPPSEAYDALTSGDFRTYSFGLQFEVPLSNAAARSQYTQNRIALDQAELNHRELLSNVTLEARQAVSDVLTTRQRIDTSRVARELAEENLRNQQKRHEVGMATTKDLLDFQTRLTTARAAEVAAKTDYAIAIAQWRRSDGQLLDHYQIVFDAPGKRSTPWFARF